MKWVYIVSFVWTRWNSRNLVLIAISGTHRFGNDDVDDDGDNNNDDDYYGLFVFCIQFVLIHLFLFRVTEKWKKNNAQKERIKNDEEINAQIVIILKKWLLLLLMIAFIVFK